MIGRYLGYKQAEVEVQRTPEEHAAHLIGQLTGMGG